MTQLWSVAGGLALSVGVLSGCGVQDGVGPTGPVTPDTAAVPNPAGQADRQPNTFQFGQTYEGEIDTTVRKLDPFQFNTSEFAAPQGGVPAWGVEFEFTNRTDRAFPLAVLNIGATVDSRAAEEIFDGKNGFNGLLSAPPLGPGQTVKVPVAYTGQGSKHVITVASLDFSKSATFTD
ncbi:hypothetical protein INP57_26785 [Saccharopolyspora sp. HNM0986]|uniref:hypothetical protein n=1 Tax=Saccharopolyspora galaxeae TaxID=2781241 RepID=UPI00190CACC1|nr:hypothetical protein [Saccharopolyspora sp. HNM0986]MBK0870415.1 hypothetical protein [Saccharopolyspora sp. HNM0986]